MAERSNEKYEEIGAYGLNDVFLSDSSLRWFESPSGISLTKAFEVAGINLEARRQIFGLDAGRIVIPEGAMTSFYTTVEKARLVARQNVPVFVSSRQIRMMFE